MINNSNLFWKRIVLGFVVWLVPFAFGFLFFTPSGELAISEFFFKTIMIVVSSFTGMFLAVWHFKKVNSLFVREGIWLGLTWLVVNWAIDLLFVAVGFFEMDLVQYFTEIGLRYLSSPIYTIGLGLALQNLSKKIMPAQPTQTTEEPTSSEETSDSIDESIPEKKKKQPKPKKKSRSKKSKQKTGQ